MGSFATIRPGDDADAQQASDWCDKLICQMQRRGHAHETDVGDLTPADSINVLDTVQKNIDVVCYFGHGEKDRWTTHQTSTLDTSNVNAARAKAILSIACKTSCLLGPAGVTSGVTAWLGFTIRVPTITPHKNRDPIGEAIVDGLALLADGATMHQTRDKIAANCDKLVNDYDTGGRFSNYPAPEVGYYGAMALRDHVVVNGSGRARPLPSQNPTSIFRRVAAWLRTQRP